MTWQTSSFSTSTTSAYISRSLTLSLSICLSLPPSLFLSLPLSHSLSLSLPPSLSLSFSLPLCLPLHLSLTHCLSVFVWQETTMTITWQSKIDFYLSLFRRPRSGTVFNRQPSTTSLFTIPGLFFSSFSSPYQFQRLTVRIQSLAKFILNVYCCLYRKDKNKEAGNEWPIFKKRNNRMNIWATSNQEPILENYFAIIELL